MGHNNTFTFSFIFLHFSHIFFTFLQGERHLSKELKPLRDEGLNKHNHMQHMQTKTKAPTHAEKEDARKEDNTCGLGERNNDKEIIGWIHQPT